MMKMSLRNYFFAKYRSSPDACIISCFFNPTSSAYRLAAFEQFYDSIKHLNHRIIECAIGLDPFALTDIVPPENLRQVRTPSALWHKEGLLNSLVKALPDEYKFIFWLDADILFQSKSWMTDSVNAMKNGATIVQPFEYCVHLDKDQTRPDFDVEEEKHIAHVFGAKHPRVWRSFASNCEAHPRLADSEIYDTHGHVGFAWGARREILEQVGLYDKALIGGADHIMAHAAAGHINSPCIIKAFAKDGPSIGEWSEKFFDVTLGKIGHAPGTLYHLWHGDLANRKYFDRIVESTPMFAAAQASGKLVQNPDTGLYHTDDPSLVDYVTTYLISREVVDALSPSQAPNMPSDVPITGSTFEGFEGGQSGGGGAGGSWNDSLSTPNPASPNFS